jgi:GAF domain-containing protein/HAMP domain-containing protein
MDRLRNLYREGPTPEDRLQYNLSTLTSIAQTFSLLIALGLGLIYLLTLYGFLGIPAWQMLGIAISAAIIAVVYAVAGWLVRKRRLIVAVFILHIATIVFAISLSFFWQGITAVAIVLIWITPGILTIQRIARQYHVSIILIGLVATGLLLWIDSHPLINRLQSTDTAVILALAILLSIFAIVMAAVLVGRLIPFRSLQSQLLMTFLIIFLVPAVVSILASGISSYNHDRESYYNTLNSVSNTKKEQLNNILESLHQDQQKIVQDQQARSRITYVLTSPKGSELYNINYQLALSYLLDLEKQEQIGEQYDEIFVLDGDGNVALSTTEANVGLNYKDQIVFNKDLPQEFYGIIDNPTFGGRALVAATSFFYLAEGGKTLIGALVSRVKPDEIQRIMLANVGMEGIETYLVDKSFTLLTPVQGQVETIRTQASTKVIEDNVLDGEGVYTNYSGEMVLGSYHWLPRLQAVIISEIPESVSLSGTYKLIVTNAFISIFLVIIATVAVAIASRSISMPIIGLAQTVERVASGDLTSRAIVNRKDEIGDLANSFNAMANELQGLVSNLEQRVTDRTRDLEKQALRLRAAAEVARDAASARNLDELLDRSAKLIYDRFKLYHTGIFLLNDERTYAVLRASPTEAGRLLIANNHRLKVGEAGIVGYVAGTGEPRIALDTGADSVYFQNPLLPMTRSEMALPLKVNEVVIGVLDVQSEQPEAFTQEDIAAMQAMADQLATAIERTRLLQRVEENLSELERAYRYYTEQSWQSFNIGEEGTPGYRFDGVRLEPISNISQQAKDALEKGSIDTSSGDDDTAQLNSLVVPLKLRGETIGVINVQLQGNQSAADTIAIIEASAERLALALESSRLIVESRRRADRERAISEISGRISESVNADEILRATVQELGRLLDGSEVIIQLAGKNGNNN